MPYTPPASNAVYFDDAGATYSPPASNAVNFDVASTNEVVLPVARTITLAGVAPTITREFVLALPAAAEITLLGVAPAIVQRAIVTTSPSTGAEQHRSPLGGLGAEGYRGHRMVLGGISREGGGGWHRSVLGGMAKEGPQGSGGGSVDYVLALPSARSLTLAPVAPAIFRGRPTLHSDVRLYVPFYSDSTDDWSIYNNTPTPNGATVTNQRLEIYSNVDPATPDPQQIAYDDSGGSQALDYDGSSGWTIETFITRNYTTNNAYPAGLFTWTLQGGGGYDYAAFIFSAFGEIAFDDAGFGYAGISGTGILPSSTKVHVALSRTAGSGTQNEYLYVNGVCVITLSYNKAATTPAGSGSFVIGGPVNTNGTAPNTTDVYVGETRIVARCLYPSGTTFTPPTEGNLSVIT